MLGVVFAGERELEPMRLPDPAPDAHDVVIEMEASGMCGVAPPAVIPGRAQSARTRGLAPIISGFRVCAARIPE
ncbi:MAG: hypothetical protein WAV72_26335 [Bradyrhizobium sp.]